MHINRDISLFPLFIAVCVGLFPIAATAQALQYEALADNRRAALLDGLNQLLDEQYEVLVSDRPVESIHVDMIVKDQKVLLERIHEAQKFLTYYDGAELLARLADNHEILIERIEELSFQPEELLTSVRALSERLSDHMEVAPPPDPTLEPGPPQPPGVLLETAYVVEAIAMADGGVDRGTGYAQNLDVTLTFDLETLAGWQGTSVFLYGLFNHGASISDLVGDLQGISNIEAPTAVRLYEAWVDQQILSQRGSLRVGLYDLNSEFYVLESAGLFLNGAHGIGPEFAGTGMNGPSIFPVTSLAARFAYAPSEETYLLAAMFDGVPGDPNDPERSAIHISSEEGTLYTLEGGYASGEMGSAEESYLKIGVGFWVYSALFEAISSTGSTADPVASSGNMGGYGLIEGTVFKERRHSHEGLTLFGRIGYASTEFNHVGLAWGAGMVYTGLIPGRPDDTVGLAVATAHAGSAFMDWSTASGIRLESFESSIEFSYQMPINDWLTIQPDVQYLINPGLGIEASSALTIGQRIEIAF